MDVCNYVIYSHNPEFQQAVKVVLQTPWNMVETTDDYGDVDRLLDWIKPVLFIYDVDAEDVSSDLEKIIRTRLIYLDVMMICTTSIDLTEEERNQVSAFCDAIVTKPFIIQDVIKLYKDWEIRNPRKF